MDGRLLFLVEGFHADGATPVTLGGLLHGRHKAVHVVTSVAIVAEQQLVVILGGPTQCAGLALDALPGVLLHTDLHVVSELEARGMA